MNGLAIPTFFDEGMPELAHDDFEYFRKKIFELSGISMSPAKQDLIKTRLRNQLSKHGIKSYAEYRQRLQSLPSQHEEWQAFINLLTTNKTDFFREPQHFDFLKNTFLPHWLKHPREQLSVWCCASSTGEEPYTLSMVFKSALPISTDYRILASDIDTEVLAQAANGVYHERKLIEIPAEHKAGNIAVGQGAIAGWFKVSNPVRSKVTFTQHNLIESAPPTDEKFDVIFCRNVLIYFSPETIRTLMQKLYKSLADDGLLFIGHSESIQHCSDFFQAVRPSIYKKVLR